MKPRPKIIPDGARGAAVYYPFEGEWYGFWGEPEAGHLTESDVLNWYRPTFEEMMAHNLVEILRKKDRISFQDVGSNYLGSVLFKGRPVTGSLFPDDVPYDTESMAPYREDGCYNAKIVCLINLKNELKELIRPDLEYEVKV